MVIIDLPQERDVFLKKWVPTEPYGPAFRENIVRDLDALLATACKKASDLSVKSDRERILRELKRLFSIDIDKVVNGQ